MDFYQYNVQVEERPVCDSSPRQTGRFFRLEVIDEVSLMGQHWENLHCSFVLAVATKLCGNEPLNPSLDRYINEGHLPPSGSVPDRENNSILALENFQHLIFGIGV